MPITLIWLKLYFCGKLKMLVHIAYMGLFLNNFTNIYFIRFFFRLLQVNINKNFLQNQTKTQPNKAADSSCKILCFDFVGNLISCIFYSYFQAFAGLRLNKG